MTDQAGRGTESRQAKTVLGKKQKENQDCLRKGAKIIGEDLLTDKLRLPPDVSGDMPRIVLAGDRRAWIENCRGIMDYSDQKIVLAGKRGKIILEGEKLGIEYYTSDDILIRGKIRKLRMEGL